MAEAYVPIFFDWPEATRELNDQEKGRLIDAIVLYARGGDWEERIKGNERYVFPTFQLQYDRAKALSAKRAAAGQTGGDQANASKPKQNEQTEANDSKTSKPKQTVAKRANASKPKQTEANLSKSANNNNNKNNNENNLLTEEEEEEEDILTGTRARKEVVEAWENEYGSRPYPGIVSDIADTAERCGFGPGIITEAVRAACRRNADSPVDYVRELLGDWQKQKISTLDELSQYQFLRDAAAGRIDSADRFKALGDLKAFAQRAGP